ncbi:hypothetical protein ABZX51_007248 [Aspergillus tubingensis]|uniref:Uncharacterized protein n=1 Tax=Aspergillus costaricaensis CBS 115574 TaxID=1448317 RepID=A0ACD1IFZ4_9EURO|nr:hypothetical protein BO79DRAFT_254617 [Aspergillus costaricaensis CBS 115574]XP_035352507.1 uncharacterized protein AtWU_01500 [Aspergillus tubingensis]RAK89222.1 hypothetical protein BO79DRAFT_254617 [Aspergillus costaricaensis CBS 115574]GFN11703.1 hypothetical protein AtWU_01500 [Aspergillus tubingensis]
MHFNYLLVAMLSAGSGLAQEDGGDNISVNCYWLGTDPMCSPEECWIQDDSRPYQMRTSDCGDGDKCSLGGLKRCCCSYTDDATWDWCLATDHCRSGP